MDTNETVKSEETKENKVIDQEKVDRLVMFIDKARAVTDIIVELSNSAEEFKDISIDMGDELTIAGRAIDASVEGAIKCYLTLTEKPYGVTFSPSTSGSKDEEK